MGHIKRMCKEEVYCRYCKAYTHATTACRTYPVTSSRKNTPEKRSLEDIEREVSRRVQEEMKRILNDLSTSRRVASMQQIPQKNQSSERKDVTNQTLGQHVQNLIGDFQRPPEVFEGATRYSNRTEGSGDQILNQQWDEPPHMQPPMIPLTASTSQQVQYTAMNMMSRKVENPARGYQANSTGQRPWDTAPVEREKTSTFMTNRQIETQLDEQQENRLNRGVDDQLFTRQESALTPTRYRKSDQINGNHCNSSNQLTTDNSNRGGQASEIGKRTPHMKDSVTGKDKSVRDTKEGERKSPQECKVIRILPDEELDFMDLV